MCPLPAPPRSAPPPLPVIPPAPLWPRHAQLATAFLLGAAAALIALRVCDAWRSRPTSLDRAAAYRIDLNRADRAELLQLPGVGDGLADRINDRRREGGFASVDELRRVRGVGPATLERLRPWVEATTQDRPHSEATSTSAPPTRTSRKEETLTVPIDVNHASADELQRLPGVGPKMAQRILDERARAPFRSVEDLRRVSGIGPKTLERLRRYVTVGPPDQLTASNRD